MHELSESARLTLEHALDEDERIDMTAPAVGSELVLTDRRLIVVREGAYYRPRSGIRSFLLDRDLELRIAPTSKQVMIEARDVAFSVVIRSEGMGDVEALIAEIRRRVYTD